MTNKELQEILQQYDDDTLVVYRDYRGLIKYEDVDYVEYDEEKEREQYCIMLN